LDETDFVDGDLVERGGLVRWIHGRPHLVGSSRCLLRRLVRPRRGRRARSLA
jgi:hypothetical protein